MDDGELLFQSFPKLQANIFAMGKLWGETLLDDVIMATEFLTVRTPQAITQLVGKMQITSHQNSLISMLGYSEHQWFYTSTLNWFN